MAISSAKKPRALANPGSSVGKQRQAFYKATYARVNEAVEKRFFVEAIALIESLLADRLESRIGETTRGNVPSPLFGKLVTAMGKEADPELNKLVSERAMPWAQLRNGAVHGMPKLAEGETETWAERYAKLEAVAKDGLKILRAVDKRIGQLRKK